MALAPASTDFIGSIRSALVTAGMLDDQIVVLDPNAPETDYDPLADTGGESTAAVVIGPRGAYVKAETTTHITKGALRYRVQFIPEPGDPLVTEGMIVRVLVGGKNEALPNYAFAVEAAPSGSISALTKLECVTDGRPVPIWTMP